MLHLYSSQRQDPPSDLYLTPHSCGEPCGRPLDKDHHVGNHEDDDRDDGRCRHHCVVQCHPSPCQPCKAFAPPRICPCGKKTITTRCSDQKSLLTCGQRCVVARTVECFNTTTTMTDEFKCDKPCGQKKNCGRHRCSDKCCPLSNSKNSAATQGWDPHLCSKPCEKKLRCGQHDCETLCHSGHCPPCQETIFTDLTCACGRSSIPPPLPCGTPPPSCQYPCSVPQPCGHPSSHSCHFGDCPPCSVPIPKECIGGHVVLRNIPCGSKDIRCNKLCGKTRQCGKISDVKRYPMTVKCFNTTTTMTDGADTTFKCDKPCGRKRIVGDTVAVTSAAPYLIPRTVPPPRCGMHTCLRMCHPSPCDSSSSSSGGSTFGVKASCGQTCGAPKRLNNNGYNVDTVLEASAVQKLPVPLQPVEVNGKKIPLGQRKLTCDDECSKVERKKIMADVFGVDTNLEALHFGESSAVSDMLGDLFRRDPKWVLSVEERCKMLVLGRGRSGGTIKVHVFCPMLKKKRDAVRLITDRWKLAIRAAGWEPKRFIVVHVTPKSKAPSRILGPKGLNPLNLIHPPSFDPPVDVDPRLVVALFDLLGDADVSALVLRFGGECELVWLNDKNALAVFSDPARAATAMRRLDHGSVYHGAAVLSTNGTSSTGVSSNVWGGGASTTNPWKKAVVQQDHSDSWSVAQEWVNPETSPWKVKEGPLITTSSANRWSILESEVGSSQESGKVLASNVLFENEPSSSSTSSSNAAAALKQDDVVVEDWEKAYD
ncbi:NF-X1-type zinc finger protein NFXL1 [Tanacetum coccineum]|uniref:NF-X1-type zinc finger protein NFXL1 n=1 Tax=Tanacetum coccineum TaxID=301880 RepID=A0ABQ4ZR45_9ASTR